MTTPVHIRLVSPAGDLLLDVTKIFADEISGPPRPSAEWEFAGERFRIAATPPRLRSISVDYGQGAAEVVECQEFVAENLAVPAWKKFAMKYGPNAFGRAAKEDEGDEPLRFDFQAILAAGETKKKTVNNPMSPRQQQGKMSKPQKHRRHAAANS